VQGPSLKGCQGDSGGSVYRGGVAYGIIMLGSDKTDCISSGKTIIFSGIRDVEDFLNVDILTDGAVAVP
jgi:hypothetical protein